MFCRAFLLASQLAFGLGSTAQAHSLPGSVLVFSQVDETLNLTITMSLHDLEIADPQFASLSDAQVPYDLPTESITQMAAYLSTRLVVQHNGTELPFTILNASLDTAEHHDVESYRSLEVALTSPIKGGADIFPLTLKYDAVMHEIRNHRALVLWAKPNKTQLRLAEFGFQRANGKPTPVALSLLAPSNKD